MTPLLTRHLIPALLVCTLAPPALQASPSGYEQDVRTYNLAHGRVVFTEKCMQCHESGEYGAPVLGNADEWSGRLEKPLSTLIRNALAGHGDMPPKGDLELTDQDVAAAVAYVAHHSRRVLATQLNSLPATGTGGTLDPAEQSDQGACAKTPTPAPCGAEVPAHDMIFNMFIMLIGQERWK